MHILCTICSDLVNASENVCVTKCGHIFHYHCLAQWNERSKTCPQCRHGVTQKCLFRVYPTISNETSIDDVATLQSRLDDAKLTTRQQTSKIKELEDKISTLTADCKKNEKILKDTERKLVTKDSAVSALKEQLEYVKIQNRETERLKAENETLQRNQQTLHGLQKVLNATTEEVEKMLESYTDVRTIATFAAALKRALCESESRKNESRDKLVETQQRLNKEKKEKVEWHHKYLLTLEKCNELEEKTKNFSKFQQTCNRTQQETKAEKTIEAEKVKPETKVDPLLFKRMWSLDDAFILSPQQAADQKLVKKNKQKIMKVNCTVQNSMVNQIENADSPYLALKQSTLLPLAAIQRKRKLAPTGMKPSDYVMLNEQRNTAPSTSRDPDPDLSIFHRKPEPKVLPDSQSKTLGSESKLYDGLGGHSKLDVFPVLKSPVKSKTVPVLTAKHKLKRPLPSGSQDINTFFKRMKET